MNEYNDRGEPHGYWEEIYALYSVDTIVSGYYNNGKRIGNWSVVNGDVLDLKIFYL